MSQNANSPLMIDTDTVEVILNFLSFIYYLCLFSYSYILQEESQKVKSIYLQSLGVFLVGYLQHLAGVIYNTWQGYQA